MKRPHGVCFAFVLAAVFALALAASESQAQTLTTLFSFNETNGNQPHGNLTLSGSTLYGTTKDGGANGPGSVFSIPVTGGTPTTLYSFPYSQTTGGQPEGSLTLIGS